eukprot:INCI17562.1.p1 GENE.INCI17562.1~~INCI17562.1.p1  ORF type:complete len:1317 (-),score=237.05 INCI17562.1:100-4050(-)
MTHWARNKSATRQTEPAFGATANKARELQRQVDADNQLYRDKEYLSLRWKIRDVMGNIRGNTVCKGVPNKVVNYLLIVTILASILFFILDSYNLESSVGQCDPLALGESANPADLNITCQVQVFERCGSVCFDALEGIFTHIFVAELIINLVVAESYFRKRRWTGLYSDSGELLRTVTPHAPFFLDPMNWMDFVAILPFYLDYSFRLSAADGVLEFLRLLKVVRVFKMARHFEGSRVIMTTMRRSARALWAFFCIFTVFVALLAFLIQLSDECIDDRCVFVDPVNTMYYVVITFSTVGYGDQVPNSEETISRFWAFLCIMFGSMFVALPLAVIGNEFELAYKQVYNAHSNIDTISSAERRQQLLNDAHRVWGTIHVARTQFRSLHSAAQNEESTSRKLELRRKLHRSINQIKIDHASIVNHLDILTPSTVLLRADDRRVGYRSRPNSGVKPSSSDQSEGPQLDGVSDRRAEYGRERGEMHGAKAFPGTIRNVSCGRNTFAIEFDDVDREQVGMDKIELNVALKRITSPAAKRQNFRRSELKAEAQRLRVGSRVLVWSDDTYLGITHLLVKQAAAHKQLVRGAAQGWKAGKCRDGLWLFLHAPGGFGSGTRLQRTAKGFRLLRTVVVVLSILGIVVQTMNGYNYYGPDEMACAIEASAWCNNVDRFGGERVAGARELPSGETEASVAEHFQKTLNWACYPQRCSNYSVTEDTREPGRMLLCQDPAVDPSVDDLVWPGILGDMTSFPFYDARLRLNISCASTVLETMTTSETGMRSDKLGRALEVENVTNIVVGEDPFPSGVKQNIKLQQQRLFGAVSVCERSKCISNALTPDDIGNPPYRLLDFASQEDLNNFFGWLELFFCVFYAMDFVLATAAHRSNAECKKARATPYWSQIATWVELISALVCTAELIMVTVEANLHKRAIDSDASFGLFYTVWGFPFVPWMTTSMMRPLRITIMIRAASSFRDVPTMVVLSKTVKEVYRRLLVPLFFLVVAGILFGGIFFTLETQLYCEAVARCQDGNEDLMTCPGQDAYLDVGVGTVIEYRYREDKCLITPTDGSPTPCYKKGDLCMMQNMYDALWLSFATISTVGYGDIYPQTSLGKGFAMLAALAGTIYLAMPLAIIGTRFYDVYEEYNKFSSLRSAKAKFQHAIGAVMTVNAHRNKGLKAATDDAERTRRPDALKRALERWDASGKSKELPMYQRAQALVEELEAENAAHDLLPSARDAASLAEDEAASAFKGAFGDAGGLFRAQQLGRLLRYSAFEMPPAERLSEETFAELEKAHSDLLSVLGEQYLLNDEWDVVTSGPLRRREHDLH